MNDHRALSAALLAAAFVTGSAAAGSATTKGGPDQTYMYYDTQLRQTDGVGFRADFTGTLQLRGDHGYLTGYYRRYGDGPFVPVTGGVQGDRVWLDIGRGFHLAGTERNGVIDAGGLVGTSDVTFHATPRTETIAR